MARQKKGLVVICSYQPKPGKQQELIKLLRNHVPTLRMLGLASGFPRSLMTSEDGCVVEIFEWESEEASRRAHDLPEVKKMWEMIGTLADFVPLSALSETQKPFAHFKQPENDRVNRVVHFEIGSDEPEKITQFYKAVFGWDFMQWGQEPYWLADTGREPCPGIDGAVMKRKQPKTGTTNVVSVESLDESIQKVELAGGVLRSPKSAVPGVGYLAYCTDPEGTPFGMMEFDMTAK